MSKKRDQKKTIIGVLSSHDDIKVNKDLIDFFNFCTRGANAEIIEKYQFLFTGGTFGRVFEGFSYKRKKIKGVSPAARRFLIDNCGVIKLPGWEDGGVTMMSYYITQRLCSILWAFWSPRLYHLRRPENHAMMRLCDQWNVKRLMNKGSVEKWLPREGKRDFDKNFQPCPPDLVLREGANEGQVTYIFEKHEVGYYEIKKKKEKLDNRAKTIRSIKSEIKEQKDNFPNKFEKMTIALIAHNEMKQRMISFAVDHEWELRKFGTILATGTTGREVSAATSRILDRKIYRYHSGPKGGDIEIAVEVLFGRCHIVIFFIDPLNPHPHIDDIRTVIEACTIREEVVMITNEMHAREFMGRAVRGYDNF